MLIIQTCWFTLFHFFLSIALLFFYQQLFWKGLNYLSYYVLTPFIFPVRDWFWKQLSASAISEPAFILSPSSFIIELSFSFHYFFFSNIFKMLFLFPLAPLASINSFCFCISFNFSKSKRVLIFLVVSIFHFCLGRDLASTDLWAAPGETTTTSPYPIYFHISQSYSLVPFREASHSWKIWWGISDCYFQFWLSCKT